MSTDANRPASVIVVLLTYNSEQIIAETLRQAQKISKLILAVDSGSTDRTTGILDSQSCTVLNRPFTNYADQRNWAIKKAESMADWQLHLDADEVMDERLIIEIKRAISEGKNNAYLMLRETYFLGRRLKYGGVRSWHLRLFKSGTAMCETRLYDQHFISLDKASYLKGALHDRNISSLTEWTARHNRWSDLEVVEVTKKSAGGAAYTLVPGFTGDARQQRRALKGMYYKLPLGIRAFLYFIFRYFLKAGFLDGQVGFYYAVLQAFWFRVLIDAKIYERRIASR